MLRVFQQCIALSSSVCVRLCVCVRASDCGSKVLAFMVADWVVSRRPHLVFIELAINDGDTLLETEDAVSIGSALEGIIRHIRDALPTCELCLLHMFVASVGAGRAGGATPSKRAQAGATGGA